MRNLGSIRVARKKGHVTENSKARELDDEEFIPFLLIKEEPRLSPSSPDL